MSACWQRSTMKQTEPWTLWVVLSPVIQIIHSKKKTHTHRKKKHHFSMMCFSECYLRKKKDFSLSVSECFSCRWDSLNRWLFEDAAAGQSAGAPLLSLHNNNNSSSIFLRFSPRWHCKHGIILSSSIGLEALHFSSSHAAVWSCDSAVFKFNTRLTYGL